VYKIHFNQTGRAVSNDVDKLEELGETGSQKHHNSFAYLSISSTRVHVWPPLFTDCQTRTKVLAVESADLQHDLLAGPSNKS
jgi:hypothetical protein